MAAKKTLPAAAKKTVQKPAGGRTAAPKTGGAALPPWISKAPKKANAAAKIAARRKAGK